MPSKVWNRGSATYKENFNGVDYAIPPGEYIEMGERQAKRFLGSFSGKEKRLEVEHDPEEFAMKRDQPIRFKCDVTGKEFRTQEGFDIHKKELENPKSYVDPLSGTTFKTQEELNEHLKGSTATKAKKK